MNIRTKLLSLLSGLPDVIQYVVVLGIVMLILYFSLTITRILGQNHGEKQHYDNPEEYEKNVPDLFASTFMKRKIKHKKDDSEEETPEE